MGGREEMNDWKYEAGKWTKIESPFIWNDGEDLKVALKRAGYYDFPCQTWGEDSYGVDIVGKTTPHLGTSAFI
jgi:hypothetical protein